MFKPYDNEDFENVDMSSARCGIMTDISTAKVTLKRELKERIDALDIDDDRFYGKNGKYVYLLELGLEKLEDI